MCLGCGLCGWLEAIFWRFFSDLLGRSGVCLRLVVFLEVVNAFLLHVILKFWTLVWFLGVGGFLFSWFGLPG